jgi:MFS family permease
LLALFLLLFFGWRGMIQTLGVLLLADAAACCFVGHEVRIARFERARFGDVLRMRPLWMLLTLFTLGTGVNFGIYNIASLYMTKELLFDIGYANRILSLSRLGAIGVAVAVVFLVDRIEQKKAMFVIMLATGVVTICMGFAPAGYAGILLFLQAIVVAGLFPLSLVVAAKLFPREMRSLATAIIVASAMFIGGGVTPYLLGLSGDLASFRLGFAILGLLICLSSPLALALKAHK